MSEQPAHGLEPLRAAAERIVGRSPADATLVSWVEWRRSHALESARGRRSDAVTGREIAIRVRVAGRTGLARTDDAGDLEAVLRSALAAARASAPSPDWDVAASAAAAAAAPEADPEIAALAPEAALAELQLRARPGASLRLDWCDERIVVAASFAATRAGRTAAISIHARTGRRPGSGFVARSARARAGLALEEIVERAAGLEAAAAVADVPTAAVPIVLAPEAAAALLEAYARHALAGRRTLAGRGAPALAAALDLTDEPLAATTLPRSFDLDGCPCADRPLVTHGRPLGAAFDLELAARAGVSPTGHALAADDAWPLHPALAAGSADEAELLAGAAGGLRVGALERIAVADDEALSLSAVARNLRRIDARGRLGDGLAPLCWRTSLAELLGAVAGSGRERIVWALRPHLPGAVTTPALRLTAVGGFAPGWREARA